MIFLSLCSFYFSPIFLKMKKRRASMKMHLLNFYLINNYKVMMLLKELEDEYKQAIKEKDELEK